MPPGSRHGARRPKPSARVTAPSIHEPVPDRLTLSRITRSRRSWGAVAAAAAVVAFVIGGVAGWMARGASAAAPSAVELFTTDAIEAHKLYIGEVRHPIEVKAEEDHLLPWLSRRVGTTLRAPDLGAFGLKLLGGRLLPGVSGPAALFMYEGAKRRALHDLLLAARRRANRVPLRRQATTSARCTGSKAATAGWSAARRTRTS